MGALVDPTTPLVDILNPLGSIVVNDAVPVRESLGEYYYDRTAGIADTLGDWSIRWSGVVAGGTLTDIEPFTVVAPGSITAAGATDLVTLEEYKEAIKETSSANDDRHADAIAAASVALLNYADRDFGAPRVTETRSFLYDGSGVLQIDDAEAVTSVTLSPALAPLAAPAWRARKEGPDSVVVYSWLELPEVDLRSRSSSMGAMGFTQNLDRLLSAGGLPELSVSVAGTWGWPAVPADIQQAVIWTAHYFEQNTPSAGQAGGVASKSVAEVAESYFSDVQSQQAPEPEALPSAARAIVDSYRRVAVH